MFVKGFVHNFMLQTLQLLINCWLKTEKPLSDEVRAFSFSNWFCLFCTNLVMLFVTVFELINATGRVNQLHLAGVKRVRSVRNL